MKVNPLLVPFIIIVTLLGSVVVAQAAGQWSTSGKTSVNLETFTAAEIKGWMTLQQVIDGTGVSQETLYKIANIPPDIPTTTALKELEGLIPDFEISTLREKLAELQPEALQAEDPEPAPTAMPEPTVQPTAAATHAAPVGTPAHAAPTPLPVGQVLPGAEIKGRMSLQEVSDQCAVPLSALLEALKVSAGTNPATLVKDLVSQGLVSDMSFIQNTVTALQSK